MARRTFVVCGALACLFGCGTKNEDSSGGLDSVAKGGQGGQAGSSMVLVTGGTGGGGSGGTSSAPTCSFSEVACNDGCVSADRLSLGNCQLLVPDDLNRSSFMAMDLDQGELFVSAGDSVYRVDTTSGALSTVTTVAGTFTFDIKASGDSIYFVDQANRVDMSVMKAPRAGGTATALTGVVNSSAAGFPLSVSGGYLVFQSGSNTLQSIPLAGGNATQQSSGIFSYDVYAAAPGGAVFYTMTVGVTTTLYRGAVPFPFAAAALAIGTLPSLAFKLHAEDDYLYGYDHKAYERVPAAGGNVETLATIGDAAKNFDTSYLSATELVYVTDTGLSSQAAIGGAPVVIGKLAPGTAKQIVADANYVYALASRALVRFSRR